MTAFGRLVSRCCISPCPDGTHVAAPGLLLAPHPLPPTACSNVRAAGPSVNMWTPACAPRRSRHQGRCSSLGKAFSSSSSALRLYEAASSTDSFRQVARTVSFRSACPNPRPVQGPPAQPGMRLHLGSSVNRTHRCDRRARGQQAAVGSACRAGVGREAALLSSNHGRDLTGGEDRRERGGCAHLSAVGREIPAARGGGGWPEVHCEHRQEQLELVGQGRAS